ncbi:MAG: hypothetical protein VW268_14500, partial [Rhodospirillaceae bacterium]
MKQRPGTFGRGMAAAIFFCIMPITAALAAPGAAGRAETAAPSPAVPASTARVLAYRTGRHAGFLRLVVDLSGPVGHQATAMSARDFLLTLPGARWLGPADAAARNRGGPLKVAVLDGSGADGTMRFRVFSPGAAFIRRVFVLRPRPGAAERTWRLAMDLVPVAAPPAGGGNPAGYRTASLPSPHGLM